MWTKAFWKDTAERAIKSFAQGALAVVVGGSVTSAFDVDWQLALGGGALMAIISVLTSVASGTVNNGDGPANPSLVKPE